MFKKKKKDEKKEVALRDEFIKSVDKFLRSVSEFTEYKNKFFTWLSERDNYLFIKSFFSILFYDETEGFKYIINSLIKDYESKVNSAKKEVDVTVTNKEIKELETNIEVR